MPRLIGHVEVPASELEDLAKIFFEFHGSRVGPMLPAFSFQGSFDKRDLAICVADFIPFVLHKSALSLVPGVTLNTFLRNQGEANQSLIYRAFKWLVGRYFFRRDLGCDVLYGPDIPMDIEPVRLVAQQLGVPPPAVPPVMYPAVNPSLCDLDEFAYFIGAPVSNPTEPFVSVHICDEFCACNKVESPLLDDSIPFPCYSGDEIMHEVSMLFERAGVYGEFVPIAIDGQPLDPFEDIAGTESTGKIPFSLLQEGVFVDALKKGSVPTLHALDPRPSKPLFGLDLRPMSKELGVRDFVDGTYSQIVHLKEEHKFVRKAWRFGQPDRIKKFPNAKKYYEYVLRCTAHMFFSRWRTPPGFVRDTYARILMGEDEKWVLLTLKDSSRYFDAILERSRPLFLPHFPEIMAPYFAVLNPSHPHGCGGHCCGKVQCSKDCVIVPGTRLDEALARLEPMFGRSTIPPYALVHMDVGDILLRGSRYGTPNGEFEGIYTQMSSFSARSKSPDRSIFQWATNKILLTPDDPRYEDFEITNVRDSGMISAPDPTDNDVEASLLIDAYMRNRDFVDTAEIVRHVGLKRGQVNRILSSSSKYVRTNPNRAHPTYGHGPTYVEALLKVFKKGQMQWHISHLVDHTGISRKDLSLVLAKAPFKCLNQGHGNSIYTI